METGIQSPARVPSKVEGARNQSSLSSSESVLNLQKLIFAGCPLSEVLTNIALLVEEKAEDMSCTVWLPDEDGNELYCPVAPSLPGFSAQVGTMVVGPRGGSCGTAVYRKDSVSFLETNGIKRQSGGGEGLPPSSGKAGRHS